MALPPIEIVVQLAARGVASGISEIATQSDTARTSAAALNDELAKGDGGALDKSATSAENFSDKLGDVRNSALAVAAAGAGLIALGDHFSDAFVEADRLGGRLNTLFASRGLDDQISKVQELGTELAGLTGGDDDATALAIGQAAITGRTNSLREYGIVLDENAKAAIKAAGAAGSQEVAQETLNRVLIAGKAAAEQLRDGQSEATTALGEFSVRLGNVEEGIGRGSASAKAAITEGILNPILSVVEESEGLQSTIGWIATIGGTALSAAGSAVALGAQVGQVIVGLNALRAARLAAAVAATTEAAASGTAAATTAASGVAAGGAAVGFGALAASMWAAVAPAVALAAPLLALIALGAAAIKAYDWVTNHVEDEKLAKNIAAGDATDDRRRTIANNLRAKKGLRNLTAEEFEATEATEDDLTPEQRRALVNLEGDDRDIKREQRQKAKDARTIAPRSPGDDNDLAEELNEAADNKGTSRRQTPNQRNGNKGVTTDDAIAGLLSSLAGRGGGDEGMSKGGGRGESRQLSGSVLSQRQTDLPNGNFILELKIEVSNPLARELGRAGRGGRR